MGTLDQLYRQSLALLTDLYQVTMAYGFWKSGMQDHEAAFNLYFRESPFGGGYAVCCGLEQVVDYLNGFHFSDEDLAYLEDLRGNDDRRLFERGFLDYLSTLRLQCDVDAIPEGTVAFPPEPLVRVRGPIIECQLLETPLLTLINFPTLIATKAARIRSVAGDDPVVDFGLRRAQGVDGAITATRAAYVGGCSATSNLLAGRLLGIPVRGTHAHSWVMFFSGEREAFLEYARVMPNNCIFLVDTYNTLNGVRRAAEAGRWLREHGHEMIGIRLDSGDLAYLSVEARKILDEAGFPEASIVASNELDERIIGSLKGQGAKIDAWGVGTRLVTGHGQPALGGIYKLAATRAPGGEWEYKLKLSEQAVKSSYPGLLQVRRYHDESGLIGDLIYDEHIGTEDDHLIIDPGDPTRRKRIPDDAESELLLEPLFRAGRSVTEPVGLQAIADRARGELSRVHAGVKRFTHPHEHPVGLEPRLHALRTRLILEARENA